MEKVVEAIRDLPLKKTWVSKELHFRRNNYNLLPDGVLICKHQNLFVDASGQGWLIMPWYYNMFHNPIKNVKMLHMDSNFVGDALGSSEIIVPKKSIQKNTHNGSKFIVNTDIKEGSYNYRDGYASSHWKHFVADIFPNVIYWPCFKNKNLKTSN